MYVDWNSNSTFVPRCLLRARNLHSQGQQLISNLEEKNQPSMFKVPYYYCSLTFFRPFFEIHTFLKKGKKVGPCKLGQHVLVADR